MLHILLCEDNPVNQKLAIRLLEKAGHRVVVAANGKEGLKAWENARSPGFDLILMDIQMPEMDGMELTANIRGREISSGKHVSIIAMTANAMQGDKERYLNAGMDGYISKPTNSSTLFSAIEMCLKETGREYLVASNPQELEGQLDRDSLLARVEGDQDLLKEMVQLFAGDAPLLLETMRGSLQQGDMTVLERSAHSIKGAAVNLSASFVMAAALQLEKSAKEKNSEASKANLANLEQAVSRLLPALAEICHGVLK
jgi:two-component system sensor histidine kinase/response regulator